MMTLDLLIINFNQKINLVSGMSQLPMSGRTVFSSFSKIDQLKIFLHDLIGGEIRDGTRPGPRHHPSLGQGCVTFNIAIPHYLSSLSSLE